MGRENHVCFSASRSHDQDGRHAQICWKPSKNLLQNQRSDFHETLYLALVTRAYRSLFYWWPLVHLYLFDDNVKFGREYMHMEKIVTKLFYGGKLSKRPNGQKIYVLLLFIVFIFYFYFFFCYVLTTREKIAPMAFSAADPWLYT